jgi:hypothetical protein
MSSATLGSSERLWQAISDTPELSGVLADWRATLGDDLAVFQPFLKPTRELACGYPCPYMGEGCPRDVIEWEGELRAVCRSEDHQCDELRLEKADVVCYEADLVRLGRHLAKTFGLSGEVTLEDGIQNTVRVGGCNPVAGVNRPVFFMASFLPGRLERLVARAAGGFLLLVSVLGSSDSARSDFLRARDVTVVELAQATAISDTGELVATAPGSEAIRQFAEAGLPISRDEDGDGMAFFPTPAGSAWAEVRLRLVDGNTISVQVRDASGVFNFAQLGMASRKDASPTVQWQFLCELAYEHGVMTWESRSASRKNQKRRELLARDLQRFFRIEGDPIELTPNGKGWKTRFAVEPAE